MCIFLVAVDKRGSVHLPFGDADTQQQTSPSSKRPRLVTDSIDRLADLREHPSKSSSVPSPDDKSPRKFRLLFGGSSEELSQPLSLRDGDHEDNVDDADDSDMTSRSKTSSGSDAVMTDDEVGKDEDVMTQADAEAMKGYVPLNAGALSYISDDDGDGNVLDFFLKPLDSQPHMTNCWKVQSTVDVVKDGQSRPSVLNTSAAAAAAVGDGTDDRDDNDRNERAKSSAILQTLPASDIRHTNTTKELVDSLLLRNGALSNEIDGNDRQLNSTMTTDASDKVAVSWEGAVCNMNGVASPSALSSADQRTTFPSDGLGAHSACRLAQSSSTNGHIYLASTAVLSSNVATERRASFTEDGHGTHAAVGQAMYSAQSCSQGSDDFRTPASQSCGVIVVNSDVTSQSAGSQPVDSDSTVDVASSPVKDQLRAGGTSPSHFVSDATTTDGWCTSCKSSLPQSQLIRSPIGRLNRISDDCSVLDPPNTCAKLADMNSSTGARRAPLGSSASGAVGRQSPSLVNSVDLPSSTGPTLLSGSLARVQPVQLCRDASSPTSSSRDHYDGDVDTDCDDVISLCGARRRRRRSSRSTVVVSSDDSDQSPPPRRSRDRVPDQSAPPRTSRDRADVTIVSSGSESDYSALAGGDEADSQRSFSTSAADIERSPVLFDEPLSEGFT